MVKNLPANAGDTRDAGLIPEWRRCPGGGHGTHASLLGEYYRQRSTGSQRVEHN